VAIWQREWGRWALVRSILIALLTALLGSQAFASEQVLRGCVESAAEDAVGLAALEATCPGVTDALIESSYAAFISESQEQQLTRESLGDLLDLQARYQDRPAPHARPDPTAAAAALGSLQQAAPRVAPKGWIELLTEWLHQYVSDAANQDNWLVRWLRDFRLSDNQGDWLLALFALLVAAAALVVLIFELRAARVLRRHGTHAAAAGNLAPASAAALTLADLEVAAVRDRAALLLKLLVTALQRAGRLRADHSLTHRELGKRASFDDERQRQAFGEIATLAEGTLYGGRVVGEPELDRAIASGRDMYAQLTRPTEPPS